MRSPEAARFRVRLFLTLMLVVAVTTLAALVYARRSLAADERRHLEREFASAVGTLHQVRAVRHAALIERGRALARKPRIHAALEDDALDLLYLNARDELRDVLARPGSGEPELLARFYRFLDRDGRVITPGREDHAGELTASEEAALALPGVPLQPQLGYVVAGGELNELIATPIVSIATGAPIGALVLGFAPTALDLDALPRGVESGIYHDGKLHLSQAGGDPELRRRLEASMRGGAPGPDHFEATVKGAPSLVFYQQLNAGSRYEPAFEICVFPLREMVARQRRVGWQIVGAGLALLVGGLVVSDLLSARLAQPVDRLAHDSAEQRTQRQRAEAALEATSAELQRAARFSADASHQLKTPVTVLRAGLEELLAQPGRPPAEAEELSALIGQTYRLSGIIDDLLLLSRIDAGQLRIRFGAVNLSQLLEGALDDLGALPDEFRLEVSTDFPADLHVAGEKRYLALILQNLLENARKYNRPQGRIALRAAREGDQVHVRIGNTALHPISAETRAHIFERFHRGVVGENIAGYGLGLNLARELARLHEGEVRLVRSDADWTEMELVLRAADPRPAAAAPLPS